MLQNTTQTHQSTKRNILLSIGIISIILIFVLSNILASGMLQQHFPELSNGVTAFFSYSFTAIITTVYTFILKRGSYIYVPSLRIEIKRVNPRLIVMGFIMIIAMGIVLNPLVELMPSKYIEMLDRYMNNGLWAMVVAVMVAPVFEEFLFRGVVQTNFIHYFGTIRGIIMGAVVFGMMHVIPQQVINATGVGLILGSIYYLTRSLNTVIAIHFMNNGFTYLMFMLFSDTFTFEDVIFDNVISSTIAYTISLIILILGGAYVIKRVKKEKLKKVTKNN